jgi:uncharacterized membrane protein
MRDPHLIESLPHLVEKGMITADQARTIHSYYQDNGKQAPASRLLLLFSILGGTLIGLGLILVIAHNWEDLDRAIRTVLAFLPMAIGQALVLFTVMRKMHDQGWREGSAVFLLFAVGACMALISQIYHIPGELDGFLLMWSLLVALLLYVPGSIMSLILYTGMITWYAVQVRTDGWRNDALPWLYFPLLAIAIPAFVRHARINGRSTAFLWAALALAISIAVASQLFWREPHMEIVLAISSLASAFLLVPHVIKRKDIRLGSFPLIGTLAILGVLIFTSYAVNWRHEGPMALNDQLVLIASIGIGIVAYVVSIRSRRPFSGDMLPESFIVTFGAYLLSMYSGPLAALVINAWMLVIGIGTVMAGMRNDRLRQMNLGLLIISFVVILRFFDLNIDDALKGLVFMLIGAGFLIFNLRQVRLRKRPDHA